MPSLAMQVCFVPVDGRYDTGRFRICNENRYNAYFYCTKVVSKVMKLQTNYAPEYYADIIQVNSKSGLRGSKVEFCLCRR